MWAAISFGSRLIGQPTDELRHRFHTILKRPAGHRNDPGHQANEDISFPAMTEHQQALVDILLPGS